MSTAAIQSGRRHAQIGLRRLRPFLQAAAAVLLALGLSPLAHAGSLNVDVTAPGAVTHDLTAVGTVDWKHWGLLGAFSENRKAGVPDQIGSYAKIGPTPVAGYGGSSSTRQSLAWSDGTPTATESGTPSGLYFRGVGQGYSLALPADTSVRTAKIYLGGWTARGRLEVSLSDGSAAPYSATFQNTNGAYDRVVTIVYAAASGGQTLDLRYVLENDFGGGNVTLSAVALAGSAVNQPPVLAPIGARSVQAGQTLTIDVSAQDPDGPAPLVMAASPLPGTASFVDLGGGNGRFEWTPGPGDVSATPYAVTFSATENNGAGLADTETVNITVTSEPVSGGLSASAQTIGAGTIDLTLEGSRQWKHWGRNGSGSVNTKAGVGDAIGDVVNIGPSATRGFSGNASLRPSFAWSDGTPVTAESGTPAGLFFSVLNGGFSLALPADPEPRTLYLYLGGYNARGRLDVSLSDGSSAPYSTTFQNSSGPFDRRVAVTWNAATAGETLLITFVAEQVFGGGNVTLQAAALQGGPGAPPIELPFSDDFSDGDDVGWSAPVDQTSASSAWTVSGGAMRQSVKVENTSAFEESYHLGTYRYLLDGQGLTDYVVRATVSPADDGVIEDVGILFRYQGPDDFYRLTQNARQGFARLEKRENGTFSTLDVTAVGYELGQPVDYEIEAIGADLLVRIDGVPVFAVTDATHGNGTIGLYTQAGSWFDDVSITDVGSAPLVAIRQPVAGAVIPGSNLTVEAAAFNVPANGEVVIEVDGYAPRVFTAPPYVVNLSGVPAGEYTVTARLLGSGGNPLSTQTNAAVAVGGDYAYAIGDSNTNGVGDNFATDNAVIPRIRGAQGYAGTLTGRLDGISPFNVVYNEGIGGDTAEAARYVRLGSLQERHPLAERALVNLGTNDAGANRDSGELCAANDAACLNDTVRGDLQAIVDELNAAGVEVWIGTVPPAWTDTSPSPTSPRISLTRSYNRAITGGLTGVNLGPDLFDRFYTDVDGDGTPDVQRLSLFADALHFNALGHSIVSILWYNALIGDATGTSIAPFLLSEPSVAGYKQNLIEAGDRFLVDSQATVTSFPAFLEDGIWVMTRQSDAGNGSGSFLSFGAADRPVDVYVAYDASATGLPGWLDPGTSPFTEVAGSSVQTSAGGYRLFVRSYAAGETVTLGGNAAPGAAGAGRMYVPIVVDAAP